MIDVALAEISCGSMLNVSSKCMQPDLGISRAAQIRMSQTLKPRVLLWSSPSSLHEGNTRFIVCEPEKKALMETLGCIWLMLSPPLPTLKSTVE